MDQRVALIGDWLRDEWSVTELAVRYGVSRKTVHKWIGRYEAAHVAGLEERSWAPPQHGHAVDAAVQAAVLALRGRYPRWGPRKLRGYLQDHQPATAWPAASTIGTWLDAAGLTQARPRRRRTVVPLTQPLAAATAPNEVWTAHFKGWFRTADQTRCDPLTILAAFSRYALCCHIVPPSEAGVRPWFERTLRTCGLPRVCGPTTARRLPPRGPGGSRTWRCGS